MTDIKKITKGEVKRKRIGNDWKDFKYVESPRVDQFIKDIFKVYEKYGMAIAHEDYRGGFEVVKLDNQFVKWMWAATDLTD